MTRCWPKDSSLTRTALLDQQWLRDLADEPVRVEQVGAGDPDAVVCQAGATSQVYPLAGRRPQQRRAGTVVAAAGEARPSLSAGYHRHWELMFRRAACFLSPGPGGPAFPVSCSWRRLARLGSRRNSHKENCWRAPRTHPPGFVLLYGIPEEARRRASEDITAALAAGSLTELPVHRLPLDDIAAAREAVEAGLVGKVPAQAPR